MIKRMLIVAPGATYSTYDIYRNYAAAFKQQGINVTHFNLHNHALYHLEGINKYHEGDYPTEQERLMVAFSRSAREIVLDVLLDKPDVVLFISLFNVPHDILRHLVGLRKEYSLRFLMAGIFTECPYLDDTTEQYFRHLDQIYVNDLNSAIKFTSKYPFKKIEYLSHKYDPAIHKRRNPPSEYQSDVFFVGTPFPERVEMFSRIDWSGINLKIIGPYWSNFVNGLPLEQYVTDGFIDNNITALFYNGTKIAVNIHRQTREFGFTLEKFDTIDEDAESYSMGPRILESVACGAFVLTTPRQEIYDVFGDAMAVFENDREFEERVRYYLQHESERIDMANRCYEILHSTGYTYGNASRNILSTLDKLLGDTYGR